MQLRLLSVNIAKPKIIGTLHGEAIFSAIAKKPVTDRVFVGINGIEGDQVADPSVHGGPDKAVYAYPAGNWAWWESEHGIACAPATFGENLTLQGADEDGIRIGDRFQWGDCVLEVAQPRGPCFKLAIHTGNPRAPQIMTLSGRVGWYCRVVREGLSGTTIARIATSDAPSVREAFFARHAPHAPRELAARVYATPALAENWREGVAKRLA